MAQVVKPLIITPAGGINWTLTDDLSVVIDGGTTITVLAGFTSDGESGPEWIKEILTKPNTFRQTAAFTHDAMYQSGIDKNYADSVYANILLSLGVDSETEKELYEAVHLFGGSSYNEDQNNLVEKAAATSHLRIEVKTWPQPLSQTMKELETKKIVIIIGDRENGIIMSDGFQDDEQIKTLLHDWYEQYLLEKIEFVD